jgi:hypothetical protein
MILCLWGHTNPSAVSGSNFWALYHFHRHQRYLDVSVVVTWLSATDAVYDAKKRLVLTTLYSNEEDGLFTFAAPGFKREKKA